jgi:hypothetical protein
MENFNDPRKIEIEQDTLKHLNIIRKWAMFFAILGFIFVGLIIIAGLTAGTFLSLFNSGQMSTGFPEWIVIAILIFVALIYFFPVLFLFRFSKHTAIAIQTLSKEELHKAIRYLRACFVYMGIMTIVVLSIYIVAIVVAGASMASLNPLA